MNKSQSGHILYLMVHIPFIWWWKIGITGKSATQRAKGIDREMFGFPLPVWAAVIPGAWHIEQWMHKKFSHSNIVFYRGSGQREWFWFWVAPIAFAVMATITLAELAALCWIVGVLFGFDGLQWFICFLQVMWQWAEFTFNFLKKYYGK